MYDNTTLTIVKCLDHCKTKGNRLAILDGGYKCLCSDSLPESALKPSSQCDIACFGEEGTEGKCGGDWRFNVHAVLT